jgi:hypothetical protein
MPGRWWPTRLGVDSAGLRAGACAAEGGVKRRVESAARE